MAEYRAYAIGQDGHFIGFVALICADDAEAIEQAKRLVVGRAIELWSGDRFVTRLDLNPSHPMSSRSIYLRDQAEKCRWHADRMGDTLTQARLRKLAEEYIGRAVEIESKESAADPQR